MIQEECMERLAVEKAMEVHRRHGGLNLPVDAERLAEAEGCRCVVWPFLGPPWEVKRGRWIGVAECLDERERRRHIAHALGHHLMHRGNQLAFRDWQEASRWKQERQADEFAAHLLMSGQELEKVKDLNVWEMAEHFGVPEEVVWQRLTVFATEEELIRWRADSDGVDVVQGELYLQ